MLPPFTEEDVLPAGDYPLTLAQLKASHLVTGMIRSEHEYQEALRRLGQDRDVARKQREALGAAGLTAEQIDTAMEPLLSFQAQLEEEITWYENVRRRHFSPAKRLTDLGRLLIALRIASGLSQKQLADRLGVSEAAVSRDERNEYHGITLERAQRILDALQAMVTTTVEELPTAARERESVGAV
jgi:DNA-directed RNA polymerase specialized sigma subunit